jgi:hypothetical protein
LLRSKALAEVDAYVADYLVQYQLEITVAEAKGVVSKVKDAYNDQTKAEYK